MPEQLVQSPSTQPVQPQSTPQSKMPQIPQAVKNSTAKVIELGILETVFILVMLVVIFGALNFFNVIPLSSRIAFLSFLPHQIVNQPVATAPAQFFYDVNSVNTELPNFIQNSVTSSYLSSSSAKLAIHQKDNLFEADWIADNTNLVATYAYIKNTNAFLFKAISLGPISLESKDAAASPSALAISLTHLYFQNAPSDWKCNMQPSSPNWQCVSNVNNQSLYSIQKFGSGNGSTVNLQACAVANAQILSIHPELGCLGLLNQ